jgi:hypothetical protein
MLTMIDHQPSRLLQLVDASSRGRTTEITASLVAEKFGTARAVVAPPAVARWRRKIDRCSAVERKVPLTNPAAPFLQNGGGGFGAAAEECRPDPRW